MMDVYKDIAPEDILRMEQEAEMNEIMPVLNDEEILVIYSESFPHTATVEFMDREVAKAQRDADRKWMVQWLEDYEFATEVSGYCKFMVPKEDYQVIEETIDE